MNHLLKKFLFSLDPEKAHTVALKGLKVAHQTKLLRLLAPSVPSKPCTVMGIHFPNKVGLAAGFDKNGDCISALSSLGFGFMEIGTVTPRPQMGNPRPRIFRLTEEQAIINRLGFNNKGLDYVTRKLEQNNHHCILGVNLGKNFDTPLDHAIDDYVLGFKQLWRFANYFTINISSPNTPGLRQFHQREWLAPLLKTLKEEQLVVAKTQLKYVPIAIKLSPDLSEADIDEIAETLSSYKADGIIATNTTLNRDTLQQETYLKVAGGLSGKPLQSQSTQVIQQLHQRLQGSIPIIATGGIMDKNSALEKLKAGASLLQLYTGFIYKGPKIIRELAAL